MITISLGQYTLHLGLNLIIYLIVAAVIGLVAEFVVGWRLPFGIIGAIIAAIVGAWLLTQVIVIGGIPDYPIYGVPIIRALIGAIILVGLWHLITARGWRGRRRYRSV